MTGCKHLCTTHGRQAPEEHVYFKNVGYSRYKSAKYLRYHPNKHKPPWTNAGNRKSFNFNLNVKHRNFEIKQNLCTHLLFE